LRQSLGPCSRGFFRAKIWSASPRSSVERRVAPTSAVRQALSTIGGDSAPAFERGVESPDPIVRVSSCFGLAAMAATHGAAVYRLAEVLASDADPRVRAAASSALGIAGGGNAPAALVAGTNDPEVRVRRAAVKALGFFDDATTGDALEERTEDDDREVAIRAAEALLALTHRRRAASDARARLEASSAWAVEYARTVAEVHGRSPCFKPSRSEFSCSFWSTASPPSRSLRCPFARSPGTHVARGPPADDPLTGEVLSATAPLIEEIGFRRYRAKDLARLTAWGLVEALWFRPVLAWWRLKATLFALIGRRPGWGTIPGGEGILEHPAEAVTPITR